MRAPTAWPPAHAEQMRTVSSNTSFKPPTNITTDQISPTNQQNMIEYTNSLESQLYNAREHPAMMTTTQETLLQRLEYQQKTMLTQKNKFMAMMTKIDKERRPRNNRPRERVNRNRGEKRKCNSCGKEGRTTRTTNVFHWRKTRISVLHGTNINRIRRGHTVRI